MEFYLEMLKLVAKPVLVFTVPFFVYAFVEDYLSKRGRR